MPQRLTAEFIRSQIPEEGLFQDKSWLLSPEPLRLPADIREQLEALGPVLSSFAQAANSIYFDGPGWVSQTLDAGKPDEIISLGKSEAFRDQLPRVIRPDLLLTEDGLKLTEIDSLPGGIGLTGWLNQLYADWPVIGGENGMVHGFHQILEDGPVIISDESSDYCPEMEWILKTVPNQVIHTRDFHPDKHTFKTIYRFFELWDQPNVESFSTFANHAHTGKTTITPVMKAFLEEKLWMALLWTPGLQDEWASRLDETTLSRMREIVPRSWLLDPAPLPWFAEYPGLGIQSWDELKRFSQKERQLVAKVSGFSENAWGSRGVHIGHDMPAHEWSTVIDNALQQYQRNPHILQKFHQAKVLQHPYYDRDSGAIRTMNGRARICPYYFVHEGEAKLSGVLATICPQDKKIIHGMEDAIIVPCI